MTDNDKTQGNEPPPPGSVKWILLHSIPPTLGGVIVYVVVQVVLTVTKSVPTALIVGLAAAAVLIGAAIRYRKRIFDQLVRLARRLRDAGKWAGGHPRWTAGTITAALVVVVSGIVLSSGSTSCPAPTELRVLTSQENLAAVQNAIPEFEQDEPKIVHSNCYVVHLTAYASKDRRLTAVAFAHGWNLNALRDVGARPDIWIPETSYELDPRTLEDAVGEPVDTAIFHRLGSTGHSPLVVALPEDLTTGPMADLLRSLSWSDLYRTLHANGVELAVPDPEASGTGLFQVNALHKEVDRGVGALPAAGDFPPDSASLLCTPIQALSGAKTAFLVSETAVLNYNQSPCGLKLVAFYPTGTNSLDFPFTTVDWPGHADPVRQRYERDFFRWLGQERGETALAGKGIRPAATGLCGTIGIVRPENGIVEGYPSCDSIRTPQVKEGLDALEAFRGSRPPANVLIGIDDSEPMEPHLHKITAAVEAALSGIGDRDSFGVWAFPGPHGETDVPLVKLQRGTTARTEQIEGLQPHDHSANYDMLVNAGHALYKYPTVSSPINAVVLLTDGDIRDRDADGNDANSVAHLFTRPPAGSPPIKLFIIAFGPAGCDTMADLTTKAHGRCFPAASDPRPLLAQVLGQISRGGRR